MPMTKKLVLLSYLSYLFRLRLLSENSYLLEGLQSADKTKTHPKPKLQNGPTFTRNRSHSHVSCCPHTAKTTIGQYQCTNRLIPIISKMPIIGRYRLLVDYRCIPSSYDCVFYILECRYLCTKLCKETGV